MSKSVRDAVASYPITSPVIRTAVALEDGCPECGGELDTGWECNDCGYDARPLVKAARPQEFEKKPTACAQCGAPEPIFGGLCVECTPVR